MQNPTFEFSITETLRQFSSKITIGLLPNVSALQLQSAMQVFSAFDCVPFAIWSKNFEAIKTPWIWLVSPQSLEQIILNAQKQQEWLVANLQQMSLLFRSETNAFIFDANDREGNALKQEMHSNYIWPSDLKKQANAPLLIEQSFCLVRSTWLEKQNLANLSVKELLLVEGFVNYSSNHFDKTSTLLRLQQLAQNSFNVDDYLSKIALLGAECSEQLDRSFDLQLFNDWIRVEELLWRKVAELSVQNQSVSTKPKVSVIVSTYNSAEFMEECLHDLESQTIANQMEVIIVDACSPKNELEIARPWLERNPTWKYYRTPTRIGIYPAWNMAWVLASGQYIMPFSTNDRLALNAVEILAQHLDANPQAQLVYGDSYLTDLPHQEMGKHKPSTIANGVYNWPELGLGSLLLNPGVGPHPMWRRELQSKVGRFDCRYLAIGDQDFFIRVAKLNGLLHLSKITGMAWLTSDSLSGNSISRYETLDIQLRHFLSIREKLASTTRATMEGMYKRFYEQDLKFYLQNNEVALADKLQARYGGLVGGVQ